MASKYIITAEQLKEIEEARKSNKNKRVEAKLKALAMRGEGASAKKISEATGFHPGILVHWCRNIFTKDWIRLSIVITAAIVGI